MIPQSNKLQCSCSSWFRTAIYTVAFILSGFTLSAQSAPCAADAGTLKKTSICLQNDQTILKAVNRGDTLVPDGFQVVYLLTYGDQLVVEQIANEAVFALPVPDSLNGTYTIHTLVYDPATLNLGNVVLNETKLSQINDLLLQGGGITCAALDLDGAQVQFGACEDPCKATAGRLIANAISCLPSGGELILTAGIQSAPIIPGGYQRLYALVNQDGGEILRFGNSPSFRVQIAGKFSIHTLVFDTATLNLDQLYEVGIVTLSSIDTLLIQGGGDICGALDMVGAAFQVEACAVPCQSNPGTLAVDNNPCLKDSFIVISALTNVDPIVPNGHAVRYLLSTGAEKTVQQINEAPSFTVSDTGLYTIHTLVYDPATFDADSLPFGTIQALAIDTALDSLCGNVDLNGAVFNVKACPPFICSAKAGVLIANDSTCLYNDKATLTATVAIAPLVPFGYNTVYLLTAGDSSVVEQISTSPAFDVNRAERFVIQALVYDTAAFKVDSIHLGETTAAELNALLLQGGGAICGALDTTGAVFQVEACNICPASAGRLTSNTDPCLENGKATLTVYNIESPTVPSGFKLAYLLTGNKIIQQVADSASFVVENMGEYTIHTLVYDFTLLDLSTIETGVTTINNLNSQLIQGGGTMCGALDVKGFSFFVIPCPFNCDADAGTLKIASESCLQNDAATIEVAFDKAPVVPQGYEVRYLLSVTDLQVVRQISTSSSLVVTAEGEYTIHTLVYDPAQLNLSDIKLNLTNIGEIDSWFFPNSEGICGAIDKKGITFEVRECGDNCSLTTGSLATFNSNICITNGSATLSAFVLSQPFVLAGYKVKYLLAFGTDLIVQQTNDDPVFKVNQTGRFTIHTLVYDPNTFNVNAPILGTTSIYDIHQLLLQGGGTICGALNTTGVVFQVNTCLGSGSGENELRAYPNPSTQKVNLVMPESDQVSYMTIELINSSGDLTQQWRVEGYTPTFDLDISSLNPGVYYVRVLYDGKFIQQTSVIRAQ